MEGRKRKEKEERRDEGQMEYRKGGNKHKNKQVQGSPEASPKRT